MTMGIYVPSSGRSSRMSEGILRFASPRMKERTIFVVPEAEEEKYQRGLSLAGAPMVRVLPCPERGIARTRLWIGQHAGLQMNEDKFLMMDDDIWFYTRTTSNPSDFHLEYSTHDQVDAMLAGVDIALDEYAHVGISAREGNNRLDEQHSVSNLPSPMTAAINTRTLRALAYQTAEFLKCEHGRVQVMEDFDVNLQLLERGLANINLAHWAQGQRQTNAPGGCSQYRSHEVQDQSARRLAELHPGVVSLRQKQNKSGGEFGTRTEVTIAWKKAYQQGLTSRRVAA